MAKKLMSWKTKGMNQDLSVSAFNPEFAFENMNLRLSTNEGNTLLSWVNEKGTKKITIKQDNTEVILEGTAIGTAVLNHTLVVFTTSYDGVDDKAADYKGDYIYKLEYSNVDTPVMKMTTLYEGNLEFDKLHPIETLTNYESETVQKVYWVDGVNQPRIINIAGGSVYNRDPTYFDFVNELALNETITVKKLLGASGMFAPGVIQYAFTYYNKNSQETNVFYVSPLLYISNSDRGVSPEDKVENAFLIEVNGLDSNFDYLRIYSIQRTSIDGTPLVKRIQDIATKEENEEPLTSISYVDTGVSGDSVDPTELLYKGGEAISAETLEQKDDTLFLGNISIDRKYIDEKLKGRIKVIDTGYRIVQNTREFAPTKVSDGIYKYYNQLTSEASTIGIGRPVGTTPCTGFKRGDEYRCGVQFQYKTGRWSEPIFLKDMLITNHPSETTSYHIEVPTLRGTIMSSNVEDLIKLGYKRARAVVVYPGLQDRHVVCQGVANPTMYTNNRRGIEGADNPTNDLYAQSSWFFRPKFGESTTVSNGAVFPVDTGALKYAYRDIGDFNITSGYQPEDANGAIRRVEIQGDFNDSNKFRIDDSEILTLHSPEFEFDNQMQVMDFNSVGCQKVGDVTFTGTYSDISIQTETPVISNGSSGFIHKAFSHENSYGIVSGLFYEDWIVDDMGDGNSFDHFEKYNTQRQNSPIKWMVYLWNKDGSLNNDVNRPSDKGTQTSTLKKKVISNLRYTTTNLGTSSSFQTLTSAQLFMSDEPTIVKVGNDLYQGNIDSLLVPDNADGMYFAFDLNGSDRFDKSNVETSFTSNNWWKLFSKNPGNNENGYGVYRRKSGKWSWYDEDHYEVGKYYIDLVSKKEAVRMKYKSTPHLVLRGSFSSGQWGNSQLPIMEITQTPTKPFGGNTADALKENIWIPCGEPVTLVSKSDCDFYYDYGDTYFQRWDCLKTYAYTPEDKNQVVEIGSFMLETHINIDGRYDRNRGQKNNLNMSPRNFNLINPVYSQINNFFTYRIMDDSYYENTQFPNQITWSKTKQSGADVDQWTNVTLASVLELDGDKGKLNKLIRLNDQLLAFQDTGISQILYNDNVQISSTDGVPIEIANSGKVQGKRYLSNTIGCSNKWSMATTPNGIYFMDSHDKGIYLFNGQLNNISNTGGFNTWCKKNISLTKDGWKPDFSDGEFVAYYDKLNQDVLFINKDKALAWSEKLQAFTSFYDYGCIPFFCNLDDTGIWIKNGESGAELWKHQAANDYCKFFGENKPYWMTLVGNPEPQTDKIFTNLEFRACVDGDGTTKSVGEETTMDKFYLPFDYLETWNEYQHGYTALDNKTGHSMFIHGGDSSALIRKFRIWRNDIPRNNCLLDDEHAAYDIEHQDAKLPYKFDSAINISRHVRKPVDRMRNPWLYLTLMKNAAEEGKSLPKAEIHDLIMTYFN